MYFFIRVISHFFIFSITIPVMVKFTPHPYGGSIPKLSKLSPPSPRSPLYTSAYSTEQRTQRISSLLTAIQWFLTTAYGLYHPRPVQTTEKKEEKQTNKQTEMELKRLKWFLVSSSKSILRLCSTVFSWCNCWYPSRNIYYQLYTDMAVYKRSKCRNALQRHNVPNRTLLWHRKHRKFAFIRKWHNDYIPIHH